TQMDPPPFVTHEEHKALLDAARKVARERDELAEEVTRARREGGGTQRLRRELGEARARPARRSLGPREGMELRAAVDLRDREIRRLKDGNVSRERLLGDARDRIASLMHDKAGLEGRLVARERSAADLESRLAVVQGEIGNEKKRFDDARTA